MNSWNYINDSTYKILDIDNGHEVLSTFFEAIFPEQKQLDLCLKSNESPIYYQVEPGDGWISIARKASKTYQQSVSIDNLHDWNKVNNNATINVGDKIIVGYKNKH